jgi:hypothetical protein
MADSVTLRPDVLHFASLMSQMMDFKEQIEGKGPIEADYPLSTALMKIEEQWKKFDEVPFPEGEVLRRMLVHIANYAMIAYNISLRLGSTK